MTDLLPLSQVAHQHGVDYFKARSALIRGDIEGEFRGSRLFCDPDSLERWKDAQATAKAADDTPGAPDVPPTHEAPKDAKAAS